MYVWKVGGHELDQPAFLAGLAQAAAAAGKPLIIVHGGGKVIGELQQQLGVTPVKVDGLRVTDAASLTVAQMVLSGLVNKQIVAALLAAGVEALGLSGVDRGLLRCRKLAYPGGDLGLVGEIVSVRAEILRELAAQGVTAVISPISLGIEGQIYNVNADSAAAAVAGALAADQLDFVSNVPGVTVDGRLLPTLNQAEAEALIASGVIVGGMIVKVRAALTAVSQGAIQARITNLDGLRPGGGTVIA
jgi:acetylglutamate kinase